MKIEYKEIFELVKKSLSTKRFEHTLAVIKLSEELASKYETDIEKAKIAATVHDITKEQNNDVQLQMIKKSDIIIDTVHLDNKNLYHALTAFLYARDNLGIIDVDILNAVRFHTTGRAGMSMLEKIIYVADACSYDRTYNEADRLRKLSFEDIDKCIIEIIEFTVSDIIKKRRIISNDTINCYNDLVTK